MLKIHRTVLIALSAALIAADAVFGVRLRVLAARRVEIKDDYARVNSFKYGLLSVDLWKGAIREIVDRKIADFQFTEEQEKVLKFEVAKVLNALITEAGVITQKPQGSLSGSIQKSISKSLMETARKNVPAFTQTVIDEVKKPANLAKLKGLARDQFDAYAAQTQSDGADGKGLKELLAKYGVKDIAEFNAAAERDVRSLDGKIRGSAAAMLGSLALFALAWAALRKRPDLHKALFSASTAFALILLVTGLSMPMIEIDARIKSVDLQLMGDQLHFSDQVLYYRSKSLTQVVSVLMGTGQADSIGVAALILLFSILFPLAKLASAEAWLLGGEAVRKNKLVDFFAFKSGKWSMADVVVVALFMAFIGFRGVINNQLQGLSLRTASLESIATNRTALQPGFVLFTAFVLYGLALSEILKRIAAGRGQEVPDDLIPMTPRSASV